MPVISAAINQNIIPRVLITLIFVTTLLAENYVSTFIETEVARSNKKVCPL